MSEYKIMGSKRSNVKNIMDWFVSKESNNSLTEISGDLTPDQYDIALYATFTKTLEIEAIKDIPKLERIKNMIKSGQDIDDTLLKDLTSTEIAEVFGSWLFMSNYDLNIKLEEKNVSEGLKKRIIALRAVRCLS